jgi:cell division protein YceG involved in septum cleavage
MGKRRNKVKNKKRLLISFVIAAGIIVIAVSAGYSLYVEKESKPVDPGSEEYISITVPAGTGTEIGRASCRERV